MGKNNKSNIGFDEFLKMVITYYFSPFATVITDFEIIKLPKSTAVDYPNY